MSSQIDSCCELRNKVAVLDSKIVEGLVVALLLLHSSRTHYVFEVHYEIEKGSFFPFSGTLLNSILQSRILILS